MPALRTVALLSSAHCASVGALVTLTLIARSEPLPDGIGIGFVHVTTWPLAVHVHPLPAADWNVVPSGNVSVTTVGVPHGKSLGPGGLTPVGHGSGVGDGPALSTRML